MPIKCECTLAVKMTGDGCRYCQPQEYINRLHDMIDEERAEAKAKVQALRAELAEAFPLLDEEGLSEIEHHCEWSIQQDRKRLHKILKDQADD